MKPDHTLIDVFVGGWGEAGVCLVSRGAIQRRGIERSPVIQRAARLSTLTGKRKANDNSNRTLRRRWTYRSYSNNPDPKVDPNTLLFGFGVLSIKEPSFGTLAGTIGGDGWQLQLKGGFGYGNPMSARFQGTGVVDGEPWAYDYLGYLAPIWPNGVEQRPAIVGTIVRTLTHSNGPGAGRRHRVIHRGQTRLRAWLLTFLA